MTCGKVLSTLWIEYKKRIAKGEKPEKILDALGVKKYCCRTVFLTHKDVIKEVGKFRF
tara:strand:- start:4220 stop:4393 length:174 start_codon:yes stop_codon:yes gene_type:complete